MDQAIAPRSSTQQHSDHLRITADPPRSIVHQRASCCACVYTMRMKKYTFTPGAAEIIAAAGIEQQTLATHAPYSRAAMNRKMHGGGNLRLTNAAKIARAFALLAKIPEKQAFDTLFVEVLEETTEEIN